jgi:hypothetical protein
MPRIAGARKGCGKHTDTLPRQHMESDAVGWTSPVSKIAAEPAPTFYARVVPAGPPLPTFLIEETLYNSPPPACGSSSSYAVKS